MKILLNWLISHFLFAGTLFFAAAPSPIASAEGGDPGVSSGDDISDSTSDSGDISESDPSTDDTAEFAETPTEEAPPEQVTRSEEPELAEFKGSALARLKLLEKKAPGLAQDFQKNPALRDEFAAILRREMAHREIFPTIAEARQMREQFPNGLQDVQTLMEDIKSTEALDAGLYTKDAEGNYAGHTEVIDNLFRDNRDAALALFKNLPKEWARLDRGSYNEVMGAIVGSTFSGERPQMLLEAMTEQVEAANNPGLTKVFNGLVSWMNGFTKEKGQPSDEERRMQSERQSWQREKTQSTQQQTQQFHTSFVAEAKKVQLETINKHPAMQRLAKSTTITPQKKAEIAEKIRQKTEQLLGKSPSFMRKLTPAYQARNLEETITLQKAAWSQPWLLNKMVRDVLRVETPAMVEQNRESVKRRTGAPPAKVTPNTRGTSSPKGPYQSGGQWFKGDGSRFTTQEIFAGKHLS